MNQILVGEIYINIETGNTVRIEKISDDQIIYSYGRNNQTHTHRKKFLNEHHRHGLDKVQSVLKKHS